MGGAREDDLCVCDSESDPIDDTDVFRMRREEFGGDDDVESVWRCVWLPRGWESKNLCSFLGRIGGL